MTGRKKRSITTRKGDRGRTSLFDETRVDKADLRPEAYGTLDEASAFIGLARAAGPRAGVEKVLVRIQELIYLANSELACPPASRAKPARRLEAEHLQWVEDRARESEKALDLPPRFVLYGETLVSAFLDVARAVMRRAERRLQALDDREGTLANPHLMPLVNRLSDLLYLLARGEDAAAGKAPRHPEP